jgi:hypothetical protein
LATNEVSVRWAATSLAISMSSITTWEVFCGE